MQAVTLGMPITPDGTIPLRQSTHATPIVSSKPRKYILALQLI